MRALAFDRTAVLFIGLAMGFMVGMAFRPQTHGHASAKAAVAHAATPAVLVAAKPGHAGDCAVPFQARMLQTVSKGQPVTIGVFGDSFGDGVWAALYRRLPKSDNYKVVKFSQEATGFTRYDSLNVEERTAAQLDTQAVDVAVIDFGANDMRGIAQDHHVYQLFTPGWRGVYGERIDRVVALLRARGAVVYWVGLPKMRDAAYDQDVATMNAFLAERMAALSVPFIETTPLSVDQNGEFSAYLASPGANEPRLMRANDGIHMTMAGYELITAPLVDRIQAYVAQSKQAAVLAGGTGVAPLQSAGQSPGQPQMPVSITAPSPVTSPSASPAAS